MPRGEGATYDVRRLGWVRLVFFVFFAVITLKLFNLQVLNYGLYAGLAAGQHDTLAHLVPERGTIAVQDPLSEQKTYPVAVNQTLSFVSASPPKVTSVATAAAALAPILGQPLIDLADLLGRTADPYVPLQHGLTDDQAAAVRSLNLPGISVVPEQIRFYTQGPLMSQLVGFLGFSGNERVGQYGVEGYWDKALAGTAGELRSEKDPAGSLIALGQHELIPAVNGDDLVLTIDKNVQYTACTALQAAVKQHGAVSGSLIIIQPQTGAVRALCNAPDFDPNAYSQVTDQTLYGDDAVSSAYEPGSVFKAITMAAALGEGVVTPESTYEDTGSVVIGPDTIKNSDNKAHGLQTMTQVLDESLNTGAVYAARLVGGAKFLDYVKRFGFGAVSGIELPQERPGNLTSLKGRNDIYLATASFGQGISATPIQIAAAFGAIANHGKLMQPYVVQEVDKADGRTEVTQPTFVRQVVSPEVARTLGAMLVSVVELGHGKRAGVAGYYVAGKTGTAQVSAPGGGYDAHKTIGTFVGFAPVDDPKFVMLVRIDEPQDVVFAESSAAPVFGDVAKFLLQYYQVPPVRPVK